MDRKYKEIIEFSSSLHNNKDVNGWTTLHEFDKSSKNKAFDAKVYKQKNRIVIAFAGTNMNSLNDIKNDYGQKTGFAEPLDNISEITLTS